MFVDALRSFRRSVLSAPARPRRRHRGGRPRPALERLEDRSLLSAVTFFQKFEGVDWTSAGAGGVGNYGGGRATLSAGDVQGEILAGYLYWQGIDSVGNRIYDNETVTFGGSTVVGASLGSSGTGGWGTGSSQAFRADVTHLLSTGVQTYAVAGLAAKAGHNANGVSLVIVYQDGDLANDRDLYVLDGNHVFGGAGADGTWTAELNDIVYRHGDVRAQFHVADGQSLADSTVHFAGRTVASIADRPGQFDGNSVTNMGRSRSLSGALWDINTLDITAAAGTGPGVFSLHLTQNPPSDSLALVALLIDTSARDVNTPPVASDLGSSGREDEPVVGQLHGTDVDGDALTFSLVSPPATGRVVVNRTTGEFTYTPARDWNGSVTFTYSVSDGEDVSNVATVTLMLDAVNDAPTLTAPLLATDEDVSVSGALIASDVDDASVSYLLVTGPANGSVLMGGDGSFVYVPAENWHGDDSFVVAVTDGKSDPVTTVVSVTVAAVNDVPVVAGPVVATDEDVAVTGAVTASDVDDAVLSYSLLSGPGHGNVVLAADGGFVYTPHADYHGDDSFVVTVTDGNSEPVAVTVLVTVAPVNDAPVVTVHPVTTEEGTAAAGIVEASDVDDATLSFAVDLDPSHGIVTLSPDGRFVYTPHDDWHGDDVFWVEVSDGKESIVAVVPVHVTSVNDPPVVAPHQVATDEDVAVSGMLVASDGDGDALSFLLVDGPDHGTLVLREDGSYDYVPHVDYHGVDSFSVAVSDGKSDAVVAVVPVEVAAVNDRPTASGGEFQLDEKSPAGTFVGAVAAGDVDGDSLAYAITAGNTGGAFTIDAAGRITVADSAPLDHGVNPEFALTVTVTDGQGGVATATVAVRLVARGVDLEFGPRFGSTINLKGFPWLPIVIYSTDTLDARDVDLRSLTFGRTGDERSIIHFLGNHWHYYSDVNRDGKRDLVVLFDVRRSQLHDGDTSATLKGRLKNGTEFAGSVPVTVTGGKKAKK